MSEDKQNYGEIICEAVSTIINKEIEKLAYDVTKVCVVIDDTYKKQGKYTVMDGALRYDAYSALTTLNIDDSVLVQIPKGDYSEQKTILNKLIDESININTNYLLPLDNMLKFTGNILKDQSINEQSTILANDKDMPSKILYDFNWKDYTGYDRMGVSFDISTRLNQYNVMRGSYGLKFSFIGNNSIHEMDFGINDMNGNLYHFDTYINQQKLFDISKLQDISRLQIEIYQKNDFYDINGKLIPYTIEGDPVLNIQEEKMNDNILMQDIEIYLGYSLDEFKGDTVKLSTDGYLSYNKIDVDTEDNGGARNLNIRWIHDNGDGTYVNFTEDDIYSKGLEIYWFRYTLNQVTSEWKDIAGPNWSPYNFLGGQDSFTNSFKPNYERAEEKIKVVCRIMDSSGNWEKYESNILTFDNELAIVDTLTYNAATQLSIHCLDDSEGNYFIYDTSSGIINEGQGQGYVRQFEARYNGLRLNDPLNKLNSITEIEWILPIDKEKDTMLTYSESYWDDAEEVRDNENGLTKSIKRRVTAETVQFTQNYSIKNNWNSSNSFNTVECKITADGNIYKATLDLQFGKAGTSGTNITLVLDYEENKNAMVFTGDTVQECIISTSMYNSSGAKIKTAVGGWSWGLYNSNDINKYITIDPVNEEASKVKLTFDKKFGINIPDDNYIIVQATFTPGDESDIVKTPVTAYLPIAFKRAQYSFIEGCRKVIYNSQGVPEYYSDAYSLYNADQNEIEPTSVTWQLKINNSETITWKYDSSTNKPVISKPDYQWFNFKNLSKNQFFYPALVASPVYIKGGNDQVCLSALIGSTVVWSQPLLIMQSQYDYATLNEWNGALNIDEEGNKILSAMIATGRKEKNDNSFSGILMGSVKKTDENEDNAETGLYGIKKGVISFSLTEQGIATFGGSGQGQIILGKSDTINNSVNTITSADGDMLLDIDYGFTSIKHNSTNERLLIGADTDNPNNYLKFISAGNNVLLDFSNSNYIIQAEDPAKLKIDLKNGTLTTNTALSSGSLNTGNLVCSSLSAGSGNSYLGTTASGGYVINFGDFKVSSNGTVTYKNTELTTYINNLISAAMDNNGNN